MKAEYIGKQYHKHDNGVDLFYKYRGHEYFVTDERNGYSESMKTKHEYEQGRIDMMIEEQNKDHKEGTFDLDDVFEMLEW